MTDSDEDNCTEIIVKAHNENPCPSICLSCDCMMCKLSINYFKLAFAKVQVENLVF